MQNINMNNPAAVLASMKEDLFSESLPKADLFDEDSSPLPPPPIVEDATLSPESSPSYQLFYPAQPEVFNIDQQQGQLISIQEVEPYQEQEEEVDPNVLPFIKTLWIVINDVNADSIDWNGEGSCIEIDDTDEFINELVPSHFSQVKFKQWVSELNVSELQI
jgi:hypothetical protein